MKRSVLIFGKPPRMGLSKTRLAKDIGTVQALRINRYCHALTLNSATDRRWTTEIYAAPDWAVTHRLPLWPKDIERRSQGHGNLGDRLQKGLSEAPKGAVIFLGTDMPFLSRQLIWKAFQSLRGYDAVFGPADDGGFWLMGLNTGAHKAPFKNVRWSSEHTLADMRRNLAVCRIAPDLPTFPDLDDAEALRAWVSLRNQ